MKKTVTFTLIMIQTLLAFSQNNNIKIKLDNNGKVKYAKFPITEHNNQKKSEKLITVESFLQEYLDLNSNCKLPYFSCHSKLEILFDFMYISIGVLFFKASCGL